MRDTHMMLVSNTLHVLDGGKQFRLESETNLKCLTKLVSMVLGMMRSKRNTEEEVAHCPLKLPHKQLKHPNSTVLNRFSL